MEVSFDVKITPGVLYDYLLYHTYTGTTGLLGITLKENDELIGVRLTDGEDNVVIVKVQNTENGVEFQEIDDEELYSKLITEYKSYDLEEDEIDE